MANDAWASGHIRCLNLEERDVVLAEIEKLPSEPYEDDFSIWKGIFHAPVHPNRAGFLITIGLSHKYFGEDNEIGKFLSFWETFIENLPAHELFIAVEQEFIWSDGPFGKFYFQWTRECVAKPSDSYWVFRGEPPLDFKWKSKFKTELDEDE